LRVSKARAAIVATNQDPSLRSSLSSASRSVTAEERVFKACIFS
jgi:hypothetical protein